MSLTESRSRAPSRRALLAITASAAVVPAAAATAAADPLPAMWAELRRLEQAELIVYNAADASERTASKSFPPMPDSITYPIKFLDGSVKFFALSVIELRQHGASAARIRDAEVYEAACAAIGDQQGASALRRAADKAMDDYDRALERFVETAPRSLPGLVALLQCAKEKLRDVDDEDHQIARMIDSALAFASAAG